MRPGGAQINCDPVQLISVVCALVALCAAGSAAAVDPARNVNVAPFGFAWTLKTTGSKPVYAPSLTDGRAASPVDLPAGAVIQVEWKQLRDIQTVMLKGPKLPLPEDVEVQWWHRIWPDNGQGGWMRLDDPFNGEFLWVKSISSAAVDGLAFTFAPLDKEETPKAEHTGALYRRTYKIRVVLKSAVSVSAIETYTAAVWKTAQIKLEWKPRNGGAKWTGSIEGRNATVESVSGTGPAAVNVRYADSPDRLSEDRGYVVFRAPGLDAFSVFVDDVIREGGVYVRDIDAFVSDASKNLTYAAWKGPAGKWDATIMAKVASMPEQSLARVSKAIPAKPTREAHLGVPNMRQEFTVNPIGNVFLMKGSLRAPGRDLDRRPWNDKEIRYAFGCGENPKLDFGQGRRVRRSLEDGWLPVIRSRWTSDHVRYEESMLATTLLTPIGENEDKHRGDEPLVLLDRIELQNLSDAEQTAFLWLEIAPNPAMRLDSGLIVMDAPSDGKARAGLTPVRGLFNINGKGELEYVRDYKPATPSSPAIDAKDRAAPRGVFRYSVKLGKGEKHAIFLNMPYIELLDDAEIAALRRLTYDSQYEPVTAYWRARIAEGMQYEVPEPVLNDLFKANLWHVLITTDRDPKTGLYQQGAATMGYTTYANETGMVAQSLEMRGQHKEAFRLIEPFLVCQGVKPLPGNFKSQDGLMYAAHPDPEHDPYTAQGYNMHHGWALWNLCEHYKWTRDSKWLASVAPKLIAACDWITRERQATKVLSPDGTKPVEWGLAPAGDLEDVREYLYFYATNAYYYIGLATAAEILAEIKHPDAARLAKDAADLKTDIVASMAETVATSPVVKLRDGTWVPCVPPRAYALTHRKEGWIREGLYPALHLLDGNLVEPHHPFMTWLLEDLEDNIFLSDESGYHVDDIEKQFFDFGGFNPQPNLLTNSHAHLRRDEVANFLRVFYNECWASLYPDMVCFAEWVPNFGKGGGPLYKTPDESHFIQYMRNMLVFEEANTLKLGMGVPRAWMADGKEIKIQRAATFFGPVDLTITSHARQDRVEARVTFPSRNPAGEVVLRLRHPEAKTMQRVTVNGKPWTRFDAARELITLPAKPGQYTVETYY